MTIFPEAFVASLRVGASEALAPLLAEPLVFAAHYATVEPAIEWPERVVRIVEAVRRRYDRHDAVLKLMEKLRAQVPQPLSADLTKRIAEGLDLHSAMRGRFEEYRGWCRAAIESLTTLQERAAACGETTASGRIARLATLMGFSRAEPALLVYAISYSAMPALQLFTRLAVRDRWYRQGFWHTALNATADELAGALSVQGPLAGSGLLRAQDGIPVVSDFWIEFLLKTDTSMAKGFVQPLVQKDSAGGASRIPPEDREILRALLTRRDTGINVLVYGKPAIDKRNLASRLILEAGGIPYALAPDVPNEDLAPALMLAQRLLADTAHAVLVVEQAPSILTRALPDVFAFFGLAADDDEARPLDERILAENPVPTVWLAGDAQRFHRDTLARFLFHAEALKGTRADRQAMIESLIAELPLAERDKAELTKLAGLSEQQLVSARRIAELTARRSRPAYARHLLVAAVRSQKALARRDKDEARLPVTRYSLDYINSAGRFGPAQILKALKLRPHGSLCLYGLPGTGKTQFAEHVAHELGKSILIKRASELLDKYLGESEKRIAEAFDQAEEEDAVLLLDEADSFLRDRSRSSHSWEVTTVNELLQRMERFEGLFICTTNLYAQIDFAALRRFTFKLEFLPLNFYQRWEMFLNETGMRGKSLSSKRQGDYEERLALMKDLTAGDFATVKRQCLLLGESLTPDQWLAQLEIEVLAKRRAFADDGGRLAVGE